MAYGLIKIYFLYICATFYSFYLLKFHLAFWKELLGIVKRQDYCFI